MKRVGGGRPDKDGLYIAQWHAVVCFLSGCFGSQKAGAASSTQVSCAGDDTGIEFASTGLKCCPIPRPRATSFALQPAAAMKHIAVRKPRSEG